MIRPITILCFLFACFSGLYLYQCKHRSQLLDREIARTVHQAELAREHAGLLRAEYTLLNDPSRLAELAAKHLASLKTTAPTQFTNWAELDHRLPPVGAPPGEAAPLEAEVTAGKAPEATAGKVSEATAGKMPEATAGRVSEPRAEAPAVVAVARPAAAPVAARPAPALAMVTPAPAPPRAPAPRLAAPLPHPTTGPVSLTANLSASLAPRPTAAGSFTASPATPAAKPAVRHLASATVIRPAAAAYQPAPAAYQPAPAARAYVPAPGSPAEAVASVARGAPVNPSVPAVASALGMARTMMAPTAVSSANAASYWQAGGSQAAGAR